MTVAILGQDETPPPRAALPPPTTLAPAPLPPPPVTTAPTPAPAPEPLPETPPILATGITESNAQLLWNATDGPPAPDAFRTWRERLTALRPALVRVPVDWARLQPDPDRPAALDAPVDGCLRDHGPCASYGGLAETFRAIASQRAADPQTFEPMLVIYHVPAWAARRVAGCERADAEDRDRPINARGLAAYEQLIGQLLELGRGAGVEVRYVAPWNEPNHPAFVSPQRTACDAGAPSRAPRVFSQLVRAARAALDAAPGDQQLVLGELAGYTRSTPRTTSVQEFLAGLPDDVACASRLWSQHSYAELSQDPAEVQDPVAAMEAALDRRPCTQGARVWVTETGAGGPVPGGPRPHDEASLELGCAHQDALLRRWADDPRVDAAFQYTFREDPVYPVGLVDTGLTRTFPTYRLWEVWGATRRPSDAAPPLLPDCDAR